MYVNDLVFIKHLLSGMGGRKMKIIELPIEFEFNEQKQCIYPSLIIVNDELTLVDTGYMNFLPLIEEAILKHGYKMKNLKKYNYYSL